MRANLLIDRSPLLFIGALVIAVSFPGACKKDDKVEAGDEEGDAAGATEGLILGDGEGGGGGDEDDCGRRTCEDGEGEEFFDAGDKPEQVRCSEDDACARVCPRGGGFCNPQGRCECGDEGCKSDADCPDNMECFNANCSCIQGICSDDEDCSGFEKPHGCTEDENECFSCNPKGGGDEGDGEGDEGQANEGQEGEDEGEAGASSDGNVGGGAGGGGAGQAAAAGGGGGGSSG